MVLYSAIAGPVSSPTTMHLYVLVTSNNISKFNYCRSKIKNVGVVSCYHNFFVHLNSEVMAWFRQRISGKIWEAGGRGGGGEGLTSVADPLLADEAYTGSFFMLRSPSSLSVGVRYGSRCIRFLRHRIP